MESLSRRIEAAWADPSSIGGEALHRMVEEVLLRLESGALRVAEPDPDAEGGWRINAWVRQALLLAFRTEPLRPIRAGALAWYDRLPPRRDLARAGVRAVPTAIVRRGAHVAPGTVLMPSLVNVGAWVGEECMVDTWATVGSCAQIGRRCHLSGGVGIGGVLEPVQAAPVIVGDDCFLGSRVVVVEGARIGDGAVLGAGTVLTGSTHVIDVTQALPQEYRGIVPPRSVVIPGTYPRRFPAGAYGVPCALIVGRRDASTDRKTSLNEALRIHNVPV